MSCLMGNAGSSILEVRIQFVLLIRTEDNSVVSIEWYRSLAYLHLQKREVVLVHIPGVRPLIRETEHTEL